MTTQMEHSRWRRSSKSSHANNCLEVSIHPTGVGVRDSKDRSGKVLGFGCGAWLAFVRELPGQPDDQAGAADEDAGVDA